MVFWENNTLWLGVTRKESFEIFEDNVARLLCFNLNKDILISLI